MAVRHILHAWLSKLRHHRKTSKKIEQVDPRKSVDFPPSEAPAPLATKSSILEAETVSESETEQFGSPLRRVPTPYPFFGTAPSNSGAFTELSDIAKEKAFYPI
ncbi:hypothetical protein ETB97_012607 [Aspergillus alliaceus]|uniref:Uncharacterized protein n=1 Tax=Petromyces alliaceus TaxID=209559 RepID=A0A5N7CR50_PETAA|nr:hypothetical protein BDV23DRAFT_178087 [Aspergillus alliaceus]KAF5861730.1 hypothetical protein ETB97_012607 [Aspergillus burnettii]